MFKSKNRKRIEALENQISNICESATILTEVIKDIDNSVDCLIRHNVDKKDSEDDFDYFDSHIDNLYKGISDISKLFANNIDKLFNANNRTGEIIKLLKDNHRENMEAHKKTQKLISAKKEKTK